MRRHNLPALAAASVAAVVGPVAVRQNPEPKGKVFPTPADASKEKHGVLVGRASAGDTLNQLDRDLDTLCGC